MINKRSICIVLIDHGDTSKEKWNKNHDKTYSKFELVEVLIVKKRNTQNERNTEKFLQKKNKFMVFLLLNVKTINTISKRKRNTKIQVDLN